MNLNAQETAAALPYQALALSIAKTLRDSSAKAPARSVTTLDNGGKLIVMPACDSVLAITKILTLMSGNANAAINLPSIQGDVVVFNAQTGERLALLDAPVVTGRRTAAVSLLAAQALAPNTSKEYPMLIVGAGVQGRAHLEAFHDGLGISRFQIYSRTAASADALVEYALSLGLKASRVKDPNAALAECPLCATCTPALDVVMTSITRDDAFITAVGAYTPQMSEWSTDIVQYIHQKGTCWVDSRDAEHEAGDFLTAGLNVTSMPDLGSALTFASEHKKVVGPVMFNNCGHSLWDLSSAHCAMHR